MKLDMLNDLKDEELKAVTERCNELLNERDRQRKEKALNEARALLESVGLTLKDVATGKAQKNGNGKGVSYHAGRRYAHPSNPGLVWNGAGKKPGWLNALEAEGRKAVESEGLKSGGNA